MGAGPGEAGSMHGRAGGGSQGRPEGGEAAELWPCAPGGSPRARQRQRGGGKLVTFPPCGLAAAFSACPGSFCLPATCAWPGHSHPGRSGPLWEQKDTAISLWPWLDIHSLLQGVHSESSCLSKASGCKQDRVPWDGWGVDPTTFQDIHTLQSEPQGSWKVKRGCLSGDTGKSSEDPGGRMQEGLR